MYTSSSNMFRNFPTLLLLCCLLSSAAVVYGACPANYEEIEGRCFLVVESTFTFADARDICQTYNGDLAVVNDCNLFGSISTYLQANYPDVSSDVWVGGSDLATEGSFLWIDGSAVAMGAPYWGRVDPANHQVEPSGGSAENCAVMATGAGFYFQDVDCELYPGNAPLCETSPVAGSCPAPYVVVGTRCLQLLSEVDVTWQDARLTCQSSGGDLAVIDDCNVMSAVIDYTQGTGSVPSLGFWIGGSDSASEGNWRWIDGSSMAIGLPFWGHSDSGSLQPDDTDGSEDCLLLWAYDRFAFNDKDCAYAAMPLCQAPPLQS